MSRCGSRPPPRPRTRAPGGTTSPGCNSPCRPRRPASKPPTIGAAPCRCGSWPLRPTASSSMPPSASACTRARPARSTSSSIWSTPAARPIGICTSGATSPPSRSVAFGSPDTPGSSVTVVFPAGYSVQEPFGNLISRVGVGGETIYSFGLGRRRNGRQRLVHRLAVRAVCRPRSPLRDRRAATGRAALLGRRPGLGGSGGTGVAGRLPDPARLDRPGGPQDPVRSPSRNRRPRASEVSAASTTAAAGVCGSRTSPIRWSSSTSWPTCGSTTTWPAIAGSTRASLRTTPSRRSCNWDCRTTPRRSAER